MSDNLRNVIVIMVDQMRATASHLWGNPDNRTPNLERLANSGTLYERAFTPHPLCVPARISFWTGQHSHTHGARRNETYMPRDAWHAYKAWRDAGYVTGLIGKNHCFLQEDLDYFDVWCEVHHTGVDGAYPNKGMEWFRPAEAIEAAHAVRTNMPRVTPPFSYARTDFPLEDYSTGLVTGQTVRFLEERDERPFALWVSYPDPHSPYECPKSYAEPFDKIELTIPRFGSNDLDQVPERNRCLEHMMSVRGCSEEELRGVLATYYGMIRFIDDGVGRILDTLERTGLDENTMVVFCSDHGDFMLERGMISKGGVFYDSLTHVPLIVRIPGSNRLDEVESKPVSLLDILPTVFQYQGLEPPRGLAGRSLLTVDGVEEERFVYSEYGAGGPLFTMGDLRKLPETRGKAVLLQTLQWREAEGRRKMVRSTDWKYTYDPDDPIDELYDLNSDPGEEANLAADKRYGHIVAEMRSRLLEWSVRTEGGTRPTPLPEDPHYQPEKRYTQYGSR